VFLKAKRIGLFAFSLSFIVSSLACDQVTAIKNKFLNSEKNIASQAPATAVENKRNPMPENTLARVGNWSITADEFDERLKALKEVVPEYDTADPQARKLVLEELIRQQLLVVDAEKTGLAKQKDIVAAVDEFRRTLLVREVARKLTENIDVTEEEVQAFYEERKEQLVGPIDWRVREIVVETQLEANEILVEALKGAAFDELAKLYSLGKTAGDGGDLGFLTEEPFPEMVNMLLNLEEGDVSSVFEGPEGFYIIKLEEKKGGETIPFEEIKDQIMQNRLLFKQQQAILDHIEKLRQSTKVEVKESLLN